MLARTLLPPAILEVSLYCPDLGAAEAFYTRVFGLDLIARQPGRHVFLRCGATVLLLFDPVATAQPPSSGTPVPPHGAHGPGHLAFRMSATSLAAWREHLLAHGVPVETEVQWPGGGASLYVRDPAGNSIELATPELWGLSG